MLNIFRKKEVKQEAPQVEKKKQTRRFTGAMYTVNNRYNISYAKINQDLKNDGIQLILRARDLAKNNETVSSYINLMLRSILGNTGFRLNVTAYNDDGLSDRVANQTIQDFWYEYTRSYKKYVSADEQLNDIDFDRQVIFNFLVDGEVFIRKIRDNKSKFGIRWQIIDALEVDYYYNEMPLNSGKPRIAMGVEVNDKYKPLAYYIRKDNNTDYYTAGERVRVPADEIIHIYKHLFPGQVRGFTALAPILLNLNSLQTYKTAEINASILNAAYMGVWTKTNPSARNAYQDYPEDEISDEGDIATVVEENVFRFAPQGYDLKSISSNHPNNNVQSFFKSLLKGIAGSLGLSYNKLASDYESTSYSSLRQANIEDAVTVKELQQFIIDNWKDIEYAEWLKFLLLSDLTNLPYSKIEKFLSHDFQGRNFEYLDPAKEMQAIQLRLALGLSSPIEEIHQLGKDPVDVLNSWQKWQEMLKDRGLKLSDTMKLLQDDNVDQKPNENDQEQ